MRQQYVMIDAMALDDLSNRSRQIIRIVSSKFSSNCYLIIGKEGLIIVDPGDSNNSGLESALEKLNVPIDYVILTHEHFDHIGGVQGLRRKHNFRIIASGECSARLGDPRANYSIYALMDGRGITCPSADIVISEDGQSLGWDGTKIMFHKTPGHSPGSMVFFLESRIFTGDTIIPGTKTVVRLPDSSRELARRSIERIFSLSEEETVVYPGHGDSVLMNTLDYNYYMN